MEKTMQDQHDPGHVTPAHTPALAPEAGAAGVAAVTGKDAFAGDLAEALAQLARQLHHETDPQKTLDKVMASAIVLIPGAQECSISMVTARKRIASPAASGDLPRAMDALQNEIGEGPCLDASFNAEIVDVPDLTQETRWPVFASRATAAGVGSMLCLRLFVAGDDLGAMNLYSRQAHAFTEDSRHSGLPLAAHAAVALAQVQHRSDMLTAIDSRDLIGQAKGILMERHKLTGEQAFELLAAASQHRNVKLRALAEELVFSGQLKGPRGSI